MPYVRTYVFFSDFYEKIFTYVEKIQKMKKYDMQTYVIFSIFLWFPLKIVKKLKLKIIHVCRKKSKNEKIWHTDVHNFLIFLLLPLKIVEKQKRKNIYVCRNKKTENEKIRNFFDFFVAPIENCQKTKTKKYLRM